MDDVGGPTSSTSISPLKTSDVWRAQDSSNRIQNTTSLSALYQSASSSYNSSKSNPTSYAPMVALTGSANSKFMSKTNSAGSLFVSLMRSATKTQQTTGVPRSPVTGSEHDAIDSVAKPQDALQSSTSQPSEASVTASPNLQGGFGLCM